MPGVARGGTLLIGLLGAAENSVGGFVSSSWESIMILRKPTRALSLRYVLRLAQGSLLVREYNLRGKHRVGVNYAAGFSFGYKGKFRKCSPLERMLWNASHTKVWGKMNFCRREYEDRAG